MRKRRPVEMLKDCLCYCPMIPNVYEGPVSAVVKNFTRTMLAIGRDDRAAKSQCFDKYIAKTFAHRAEDKDL